MVEEELAPGWTRWHEGPDGTLVWTFRPDVFDGQSFPAACLPTLTVKRARSRGPRGRPSNDPNADWSVEFRLEADVELVRERFEDRSAAVEAAFELASAFSADELDPREAYLEPRGSYLERLEELLPAEPEETRDFSPPRGNQSR